MDFLLFISENVFIISIKEKDILLRSNHLNKRQHQLRKKIGLLERVHRQHQVQAG
jgi:hypothetical protein